MKSDNAYMKQLLEVMTNRRFVALAGHLLNSREVTTRYARRFRSTMIVFCGVALAICGPLRAAETAFYGINPEMLGLVEIDPYSGETTLAVEGHFWTGLDYTPDGKTLYGLSNRLFTIDVAAGTYSEIGPLTLDGSDAIQMLSMSIAPDGKMYALSNPSNDPAGEKRFYRVDPATGNLEYLGSPAIGAIEFAPDGTLYAVGADLMILDPRDGSTLQTIGPLDSQLVINELDFSEDGNLYGTSREDGLHQINTTTGAATLLTGYLGENQVWSLVTVATGTSPTIGISGYPPTIEWQSTASTHYQVSASQDLRTWVSVSEILQGSDSGVSSWTDDGQHDLGAASATSQRFYRVEQVTIEPTVRFYAGTGSGGTNEFDLVEIDPSSGETTLAVAGRFWTGLDFTPDGQTLYAVGSSLYTIDIAAGTYLEIGPLTYQGSDGIWMLSMTVAPDGRMYALSSSSSDPAEEDRFYRVDTASGNLEYLGTPQGFVWAIEFAPDGTLYGAQFDLMILDPENGSIRQTIGDLGDPFLTELDFSKDGNLYGVDSDEGVIRINTATGAAALTISSTTGGDELRTIATH